MGNALQLLCHVAKETDLEIVQEIHEQSWT